MSEYTIANLEQMAEILNVLIEQDKHRQPQGECNNKPALSYCDYAGQTVVLNVYRMPTKEDPTTMECLGTHLITYPGDPSEDLIVRPLASEQVPDR